MIPRHLVLLQLILETDRGFDSRSVRDERHGQPGPVLLEDLTTRGDPPHHSLLHHHRDRHRRQRRRVLPGVRLQEDAHGAQLLHRQPGSQRHPPRDLLHSLHVRGEPQELLAVRGGDVSRRPLHAGRHGLPQLLHPGRHEHRPVHRHCAPFCEAHHAAEDGVRDRRHLGGVAGHTAADAAQVAHGVLLEHERPVSGGVAGPGQALRLQPGPHGAAVLRSPAHPHLLLFQNRI